MVDANILQGAIFHEDAEGTEVTDSIVDEGKKGNAENLWTPVETKLKQVKAQLKPAAHRVIPKLIIFTVNLSMRHFLVSISFLSFICLY